MPETRHLALRYNTRFETCKPPPPPTLKRTLSISPGTTVEGLTARQRWALRVDGRCYMKTMFSPTIV